MSFIKKITRRSFIKRAIITIVSLELIYVFVNLLKKGNDSQETSKLFDAGEIDTFENGKVYPFNTERFYLSRLKDGGFLAISTKCTHLGCTVQFKNSDNKFLCPCHASAFNKHGEVLAPPATRALDLFPITISNDKVMVDTANPVKRNKHNRSQITYA
ncbi:QcrA and Rieske domain-containing protein [Carboxylicivirga marina]|uniref:Ubiquinol-cytochrome c reductase iron-sulfur subunit n=1 Tax=Carboxylicivirga marina TaxID=2800988 RepID=A0ABS1HL18_9BACT|nr:ubiquinol-cytochrome c reductase iron-sulfur subunit [Carboxylicivirga marina]MBK3518369.1 ubiquinol-cytochrome c reductase iron-sulfur subunit [Carboxylicivirga marina]